MWGLLTGSDSERWYKWFWTWDLELLHDCNEYRKIEIVRDTDTSENRTANRKEDSRRNDKELAADGDDKKGSEVAEVSGKSERKVSESAAGR